MLDLAGEQRVRWACLGRREQGKCCVELARLALRPRGGEGALCPTCRIGRQPGRALEERRRRDKASARPGPPGRSLEIGSDRLVRRKRRLRQVPGPAIGIGVRIGRLRQGSVYLVPLRDRGDSIRRGSHHRVAEPDPLLDLDEARLLGCGGRLGVQGQRTRGAPEDRRVAKRFGSGDEQQPTAVDRQRFEPPPESFLDATGEGHRVGLGEDVRQFRGRPRPREFEERERVAAGLGEDAIADPRIQRTRDHRVQ